ncbi:MAG TPA: response regulator, partial [Candidatus Methanoperedens sp.]|nr:response regulator [Candidatus Methanoperedens sp.]
LVAHDSLIFQTLLRRLLSPAYEVLATGNGAEAMNLLATRKIDALILGIGLELLDGCSIASYLKRERRLTLPIVFWTSNVEGSFGQYLEECGADLVLEQGSPDSLSRLQRFLGKNLR